MGVDFFLGFFSLACFFYFLSLEAGVVYPASFSGFGVLLPGVS